MIKITANSLKDFQTCSRLYDFKYNDKLPNRSRNTRDRKRDRFDETIKKVTTFFFYKKQSFTEPSYQALLNRWQKLWFADGTTAADIALLKNEIIWGSETSYTTQAALAFLEFHKTFADKSNEQVFMIDEPFAVPFGKEIAFEGVFDLVLREKREDQYVYKIYKWITGDARRSAYYWTIDFAMQSYAFQYKMKSTNTLKIEYYIWDFGSTVPGLKQVEVEVDDINALKFWAGELSQEKIFPSRRGLTSYCKSCEYNTPECLNWKMPDPGKVAE